MHLFNALLVLTLIGMGSSLDNTSIGIAYGVQRLQIPHWVNVIINTVGFFVALISAYAGTVVARYISPTDAEWMAFIILSMVGSLILYGNYIHPRISKSKRAIKLKAPGFKAGIVLGVGLCFSNIAGGFGATVAMPSSFFIWGATISITAFGYLGIWLGNIVGDGWMSKVLGRYASLLAGLLLITAGVHQVL